MIVMLCYECFRRYRNPIAIASPFSCSRLFGRLALRVSRPFFSRPRLDDRLGAAGVLRVMLLCRALVLNGALPLGCSYGGVVCGEALERLRVGRHGVRGSLRVHEPRVVVEVVDVVADLVVVDIESDTCLSTPEARFAFGLDLFGTGKEASGGDANVNEGSWIPTSTLVAISDAADQCKGLTVIGSTVKCCGVQRNVPRGEELLEYVLNLCASGRTSLAKYGTAAIEASKDVIRGSCRIERMSATRQASDIPKGGTYPAYRS